jgi:ADP-heptose:LPS heptosyltransferase
MKALVVRLSSIGDVVHTLPALAALRRAGWETGWLVEPPARPLLERNPALVHVASVPPARAFRWSEAARTRRALRASGYDVALDFQGLWKSAAWARLSGARETVGFARVWRREPLSSVLLGRTVSPGAGAVHVIDHNLALLRALGVEAVGTREFPLPDDPAAAERVARDLGGRSGFALLNPGGGWKSKVWPPERFGALASLLHARGLPALVTWGPGEEALADAVVAASRGAARRTFPTTLLEYVELARRARVVVAADTGPLHLACAVGTPVVALFGPTDPARNGPFAPADVVVHRRPACFPCHRRQCAVHADVMAGIAAAEVAEAVDRRLGAATPADAKSPVQGSAAQPSAPRSMRDDAV